MLDPIRIIYGIGFVLSVYGVIRVILLEISIRRERRKARAESKENKPE